MRARSTLLLALLRLAACAYPAPGPEAPAPVVRAAPAPAPAPQPVPAPEPARPPEPVSLFQDAVIGYVQEEDAMLPPAMELCPVPGRTYVCGLSYVPLISTDRGVITDPLEADVIAGTARPVSGRVVSTAGEWPGSPWMLMDVVGAQTRYAYHLENGRWRRVATWHPPQLALPSRAAEWNGRLLIYAIGYGPDEPVDPPAGMGALSPLDRTPSRTSLRSFGLHREGAGTTAPVRAMASDREHVYVVVQQSARLVVDRLDGPAAKTETILPLLDLGASARVFPEVAVSAGWGAPPAIYGSIDRYLPGEDDMHHDPLLFRMAAGRFEPVAIPPGQTRVAAYEGGVGLPERLFTYAGDTLSFFERPAGSPADDASTWRPVPLPKLDPGGNFANAWLANGDAWVLVWPNDMTKNPPRLMRTKPVKDVWVYHDEPLLPENVPAP